jgi:hypothetical protein
MANIGIFSCIAEPTRMLFKLVNRKYRIPYSFFGQDANLVIFVRILHLRHPKVANHCYFFNLPSFPLCTVASRPISHP